MAGLARAIKNADLLLHEIHKYNPVQDGIGGFKTTGGKITKPGGHYREIQDLIRGIKNGLIAYNNCRDCDDVTPPAYPRNIDKFANRPITEPVYPDLSFWDRAGVGAIGVGIIVFDILTVPTGEGALGVPFFVKAFGG